MNVLYIDIDSLRPDHLGCYGYHRNTSPNIDTLAAEGLRFSNCHTPDAPCLPSRSAMTTGRFGFHTGVVNHGGTRCVMFPYGRERGFGDNWTEPNWASQFKRNGYHTVAFSPFAERHGAWHWYAGFMEMEPMWMFNKNSNPNIERLQPKQITDMEQARRMFDGYDLGVSYADLHVGRIVQKLKDLGLYENTAILVSADHGENLGELWVYGDHQTADSCTHRIPMIMRWPGVTDDRAGECDNRLHYNIDMAATTLELAGPCDLSRRDGRSFAASLETEQPHRESLVLSQLAWCAQRSARWDQYLCIQTFHDGWHDYPEFMVFDLEADPHE